MQHSEGLKRLRELFRRDPDSNDAPALSGPTLLDQEPDLRQETARYNAAASGWAAGGHSND